MRTVVVPDVREEKKTIAYVGRIGIAVGGANFSWAYSHTRAHTGAWLSCRD